MHQYFIWIEWSIVDLLILFALMMVRSSHFALAFRLLSSRFFLIRDRVWAENIYVVMDNTLYLLPIHFLRWFPLRPRKSPIIAADVGTRM